MPRPRDRLGGRRLRERVVCVFLIVGTAACSETPVAVAPPGAVDLSLPWTLASPAQVGMDGDVLERAAADASGVERFRSLLVVKGGRLVFERYFEEAGEDGLADVRSVTKSVVSILTGLALDRGDLSSLDQPIGDVLRLPELDLTPDQQQVTIRHLLSMTSGFRWGDETDGAYNVWILALDHLAFLLGRPIDHPSGTQFNYNSAAVHLLGVVLEESTGQTLADFSEEVLFGPMGIGPSEWEALTAGRVNGSSGLDLRPRDLAKIGQLMLQHGWSGNRSLVSEAWVETSTSRHFPWTNEVGPLDRVSYGYLWWVDVANGAYYASGFGGQTLYVDPDEQLVVVATTRWPGVSRDFGALALRDFVMDIIVTGVRGAIQ